MSANILEYLTMKETRIILTLLVISLYCCGFAFGSEATFELFKSGLKHQKSLQIFTARDKFREALHADPDNSGYLTHYAWFLHYHSFHEEAASVFVRLIHLSEDRHFLYLGLAWNRRASGRLQSSLDAYQQALPITSEPEKLSVAFEEISWLLHEENRIKLQKLQDSSLEEPLNLRIKKDLFQAYIEQGELEQAVVLGKEIMAHDSEDKWVQLQYARILSWKGDINKSEIQYRDLIAALPDSAFLLYELGRLIFNNERYAESKVLFEDSLQLYPDSAFAKKGLAEALAKTGNHDKAALTAEGIEQAGDTKMISMLAEARVRHFTGHYNEARALYLDLLNTYPYNIEALWGLIETSSHTNSYDDLRYAERKWESTAPEDRPYLNNLLVPYYKAPVFNTSAEYYTNSSDYTRVNIGADYGFFAGSRSRLKIGYHASDFQQDGLNDIFRNSISIEGSRLFSRKI